MITMEPLKITWSRSAVLETQNGLVKHGKHGLEKYGEPMVGCFHCNGEIMEKIYIGKSPLQWRFK